MLPALAELPLLAYASARNIHYTTQFYVLTGLSMLDPATPRGHPYLVPLILKEMDALLRADVRRIREGLYPPEVLRPEPLGDHLARMPRLFWDAVQLHFRRREGNAMHFDETARQYLDEVPAYYRRNYHFQAGGYLSEESAALYEHQVEILFGGTADAMRRLAIAPLKAKFPGDGQGLTFLELGAGTGRATRMVQLAFPKARVVAQDLSTPYLKLARKNLHEFPRVDFLQGDAADLPLRDGSVDAVFSVFMFHEMPLGERRKVLNEAARVLKPGGIAVLVDSAQLGDHRTFDPLLENFPRGYHEPFYQNYLRHPLGALLKDAGFTGVQAERGFLSKVAWGETKATATA